MARLCTLASRVVGKPAKRPQMLPPPFAPSPLHSPAALRPCPAALAQSCPGRGTASTQSTTLVVTPGTSTFSTLYTCRKHFSVLHWSAFIRRRGFAAMDWGVFLLWSRAGSPSRRSSRCCSSLVQGRQPRPEFSGFASPKVRLCPPQHGSGSPASVRAPGGEAAAAGKASRLGAKAH